MGGFQDIISGSLRVTPRFLPHKEGTIAITVTMDIPAAAALLLPFPHPAPSKHGYLWTEQLLMADRENAIRNRRVFARKGSSSRP